MINPLISRLCLSFPLTPKGARMTQRLRFAATGQGHNATTLTDIHVVTRVVPKCPTVSVTYPPPTTPQRKIALPSYVCACVRACTRNVSYIRCAVVSLSYPIDNKGKKTTTGPQRKAKMIDLPLWAPLWLGSKSLKTNKILGFY